MGRVPENSIRTANGARYDNALFARASRVGPRVLWELGLEGQARPARKAFTA
jgi:hypothetical protein